MNKIDISNWKDFEISDIFKTIKTKNRFNVPTGAGIAKRYLKDGNIPRISVTNFNNGILGFFADSSSKNYRKYKNFISVSFLGTAFYHSYVASLDMKVHCLQLKDRELNEPIALFLIGVIKKAIENYEYSDQLSSTVLPKIKIKLPVDDCGNPNWEYMENYIKRLETRERERVQAMFQGI